MDAEAPDMVFGVVEKLWRYGIPLILPLITRCLFFLISSNSNPQADSNLEISSLVHF